MQWSEYTTKILKELDTEAFYLHELPNGKRHGNNEYKTHCPFKHLHKNADKNPSFTVNLRRGTYLCQTCKSKGNAHTLLVHLYNMTAEDAWHTLGDNLGIDRPASEQMSRPPIDIGLITKWHHELLKDNTIILRVLLEKRGLTLDTIVERQLGWDGERITIPIYNEFNEIVNVRRYKWDAPTAAEKFFNYKDEFGNTYGELQLYGIENLVDKNIKEIVYCEGETDRIILEQHGFKAVTPTSGTGSFRPEWVSLFRNKVVYVLQDNDEAGENGDKIIADKLYKVAKELRVVQWPENFINKGDATDWFTLGHTADELRQLFDDSPIYGKVTVTDDTEVLELPLAHAANHEYMGKRHKIPIMISGKDTAPFIAPRNILIKCTPGGKGCENCGIVFSGGEHEMSFTSSMQETLTLIQCTKEQQQNAIKSAAGIPSKCFRCNVEVLDYMNVEEIRAIPQADNDYSVVKDAEYVVRKCYYIGRDIKTNQRYMMAGYPHAEPKTQYVTHIFDEAIPNKDRVDSFIMDEQMYEQLKIFQPAEGQRVEDKFQEIHKDFERNVTKVWERRDVGIAADLVYHTALSFIFQEQFVRRGWAELLIIGDSGQAKSTLIERLMNHYMLGEFYSGESSKRTGLVYNFQQTQKRWFLSWGAFPLNDGGLIVIDEFSGIPEEELALMSDVRSSGVARATGVISAETNSRTRAVYISNPRNGMQLNTESHGVNAVLKLFGKAEDVRRLDLVIGVASGDVSVDLINRSISKIEKIPHVYTSEACRNRVLWCWSRKPTQVKFEEEAEDAILSAASAMGKKYSSKIPIVESADQRLKIARLSIACAGCMFSTDNGENLIVKKDHVEFVVSFLNKIYDAPNLDYNGFSESNKVFTSANEEDVIKTRKSYSILPITDVNDVASLIHGMSYFSRYEMQDIAGVSSEDASRLISFMLKKGMIERTVRGYRKTPLGIAVFRSIKDKPITSQEVDESKREAYREAEF